MKELIERHDALSRKVTEARDDLEDFRDEITKKMQEELCTDEFLDIEFDITWECPTSPIGICVYCPATDPGWRDDCVYCHEPYERK